MKFLYYSQKKKKIELFQPFRENLNLIIFKGYMKSFLKLKVYFYIK